MKDKNIKIQVILVALYFVFSYGCKNKESIINETNKVTTKKSEFVTDYPVEAPPFSDGAFPCTDCHANFKPNPVKRVLTDWHQDISEMFNHDSQNR